MPRPKKPRCILSGPMIKGFKPEGVKEKGEVTLSFEEFEAIRHIDYEGLDQSQAAKIMDVSRQTFGRILKSARFNLSSALVNAYRLRVKGGCYTLHGHGHGHHGQGWGRKGRGRGHGKNAIETIQEDKNE